MFGIGGTELIVIGIVLLIAVGPKKLPNLLKAAIKGYREFQRATRDLRASTGIDEILRDEELNALRKPLYVPPAKPVSKAVAKQGKQGFAGANKPLLGFTERARELPEEGVDVVEAEDAFTRPSPEEADRIRAEKQAIVDAKLAAKGDEGLDDEARQEIIRAKNAAAGLPEHDDEHDRIVQAKIAAAEQGGEHGDGPVGEPTPIDEDERQRIIDRKVAASAWSPSAEPVDEATRQRIIDAKLAAVHTAVSAEEPDTPEARGED
ncbi:MAG: twin-arginine translocase TatA/TatE family subunit [Sandaracinaceae bacterium]